MKTCSLILQARIYSSQNGHFTTGTRVLLYHCENVHISKACRHTIVHALCVLQYNVQSDGQPKKDNVRLAVLRSMEGEILNKEHNLQEFNYKHICTLLSQVAIMQHGLLIAVYQPCSDKSLGTKLAVHLSGQSAQRNIK